MDPLSTIASIASLACLTAASIKQVRSYISSFQSRRGSIEKLSSELEALLFNLNSLDAFLRKEPANANSLAFDKTSVLRSCTVACEKRIVALCRKLDQVADSKSRQYFWPLAEKEHEKAIEDLRAFTQWFQFAMTVDGCALLAKTREDVLTVLGGQLKSFDVLKNVDAKVDEIHDVARSQLSLMEDASKREEREGLVKWLCRTDQGREQRHRTARSLRTPGTGRWLFEMPQYRKWQDDAASPNIVWCHGMQGCGKTILTSIVIDDLQSNFPGVPFASFYFDYQDQDNQKPDAVISNILSQITASLVGEPPSLLLDVYRKRRSSGLPLALHELEKLALDTLASLGKVFIVLDALDECDADRHRGPVIAFIEKIKAVPSTRLLVTSRPHPSDIYQAFRNLPQITIQASEHDLGEYMKIELEKADISDVLDSELKERIVGRLQQAAQGMFLLPVLQLRSILKEPTVGDIEDALENLAHGLPEAFRDTIARINRQPSNRRTLGMKALMWISHARRPMTSDELSEALSLRPGQTHLSRKHCPSAQILVECSQGLVILDDKTEVMRLAHLSLQEFLLSRTNELFPDAEESMAMACIGYLMFDHFACGPLLDGHALHAEIYQYRFLHYAAYLWGAHARCVEHKPAIQETILRFLQQCSAAASLSTQVVQFCQGRRLEYWTPEEAKSVAPLHFIASFGLIQTAKALLAQQSQDVDVRTSIGTTPLMKACSRGHVDLVRVLIAHGADPYMSNWYGNSLHSAAEAGQPDVIRELVAAHGMDPDVPRRAGDEHATNLRALHCTMDHDEVAAFETLVELGASLSDACECCDDTILHLAVHYNNIKIVKSILRRELVNVDCPNRDGLTPLHLAAVHDDPCILLQLISAGANIHAQDVSGRTPLRYVLECRNEVARGVLLQFGADASLGEGQDYSMRAE